MKEIVLSDEKVVSEIKAIQSYVRKKGLNASETDVVLACIRLAKRLGSDNWSIYLELKTMLGGEDNNRKYSVY